MPAALLKSFGSWIQILHLTSCFWPLWFQWLEPPRFQVCTPPPSMLPESCKQLIHTSLHMVANPPNWHRPEVDNKTESEHLEIDQYRFIVFILQNFIWTFASWTCCTSNNFQALAIHPNLSTPSNTGISTLFVHHQEYPESPFYPRPSTKSRASCCRSVGIFSSYIFAGYLLLSSSQSNPCLCFDLDNNCLMLLSAIAIFSQSWASQATWLLATIFTQQKPP